MIGVAKKFSKETKTITIGAIKTTLSPTIKNKTKLRRALFSSFPELDYFVIFENDAEFIVYKKKPLIINLK